MSVLGLGGLEGWDVGRVGAFGEAKWRDGGWVVFVRH